MQGVPGQYIKNAAVDWPLEFFSSAGGSLRIGNTVLPAPSYGVWAMLELLDCDFVHPYKEATVGGAIVAAYIAAHGREAIPLVKSHLADGREGCAFELDDIKDESALIITAVIWAGENEVTNTDEILQLCEWFSVSFAGFAMIPSCGGGSENMFGMDSFGAIVAAVGSDLGENSDGLMWNTPLTVVGHAVAQKSKQHGAKGIARPKDPQSIKEQIAETKRRGAAGLLYEWQEKEPLQYGLDGHENEDEAYRFAVLQHEARTKGVA